MSDLVERDGGAARAAAFGCWTGAPAGFRQYVDARRYDFGRGSAEAWKFIAIARGDDRLPDAKSWRELESYLRSLGSPDEQVAAARSVWRSFTAYCSRARRREAFR